MTKIIKALIVATMLLSGVACHSQGIKVACESNCPVPNTLSVSVAPTTIAIGGTALATAQLVNTDGSTNTQQTNFCVWTSDTPSVATVSTAPAYIVGTVTGVSAGTANIICNGPSALSASAQVTVLAPPIITSPSCITPPCAMTAATNGLPYAFQATQSGGTAPIVWSISVPGLPTGISMSSSGTFSGTPTVNGTYTFTILETANNGTFSVQASITVSANPGCGPPNYPCTPSNVNVAWNPVTIPFSGLGASSTGVDGTIVTIPEPGQPNGLGQNPQIRVSNGHTFCGAPSQPACGVSSYLYDTGCVDVDGSADGNHWNTDDTMFFICDQNSGEFSWLYSFNPGTLVPTFKYTNYSSSGQAVWGSKRPAFARTNSHTVYGFADATNATAVGTYLWSWDVSVNYPSVPVGTRLFDMSVGGSLFPTTYSFQSDSPAGDATDTIFADGFANTNAAHSARYVAWHNTAAVTGIVYASWNTATGAYAHCQIVIGVFNCAGNEGAVVHCQNCGTGITSPGTFSIHNVRMQFSGSFVLVAPQACDAGVTCYNNGSEFAFDPLTGNVWATCGGGSPVSCGGHWTPGYNYWFNNLQRGQETGRIISSGIQTPTKFPATLGCPYPSQTQDQHLSYNNQDSLDDHYVAATTSSESVLPDYTQCWTNELILYAPPASAAVGTVKRMGHNYTGPTPCFDGQIANISISQTGKFTLFASTMNAGLGCANGTTSCTVSTAGKCTNLAPRADVFINQNK